MATASSAVVSDDVADVLGEVGILTVSGEPVKFRDLWDQQEFVLLNDCGNSKLGLIDAHLFIACFSWELASALKESKELFYLLKGYPSPWISRKAYDVLGLYYGLGLTFFNPASTKMFSRIGELTKSYEELHDQGHPG